MIAFACRSFNWVDGHGSPSGMYDVRIGKTVNAEQIVQDIVSLIEPKIDTVLICGCQVGQNKAYNKYIQKEVSKGLGRKIIVFAGTGYNSNYQITDHRPDTMVGSFLRRLFGGIYYGNGLFGTRTRGSWGQLTSPGFGTQKIPTWIKFD